jgi:NCS1 family nucleobase:cation symporter-1
MPVAEAPQRIEDKTIQPIPLNERHGRPRDLFSLWFGSNIMLLTVVTGARATSVYQLPSGWRWSPSWSATWCSQGSRSTC